ncbi:MAG: sulfur reduction protein DsrE [Deltaproteobacteria bacterium RIFCSPLOWO2_02_FULL_46_8]|nr:MAG: sulfur reduction protein DsrE [Deltaproteobacteria bacterium RIFCSPLOWO2_02_FULL_46_8]
MKLALVIHSDDPEIVWNAFRLANFAIKEKDTVKVFLLARGVEVESLNTEQFKITEQMKAFLEGGGQILACGTCLKLREKAGSELCPLSTMKDLYELIRDSDRVLTF